MRTEALWQLFAEDLRRWILRRVRDEHAAEDLLQEVYLRIHRSLPELRDERQVAAWIYRTARNAVVDRQRQRVAQPSTTIDPEDLSGNADDGLEHAIGTCLRGLIQRLDEPYRSAIELVELEGLSQSAVATRLGLSASGLKSRVQRGRRQLKDSLLACCALELDATGRPVDWWPNNVCNSGPNSPTPWVPEKIRAALGLI